MGGCKRLAALVFITIGAGLIVAVLAGEQPARAEVEPALVGVPRDVYPEYVIDQDDRPAGFGVDLIKRGGETSGVERELPRVCNLVGHAGGARARRDRSHSRRRHYSGARTQLLFTRPVLTSPLSIFVRQDEENIRSVADLAGRRMG